MSQPLVSIIITTYNHSHFLSEAIESALAQSEGPTEIIVVDDGSTDDPAAVVARYPQVRLIRQDNQGLPAARNTGWRACCGRYVVFLDADDRLLPDALAVNRQRFADHPECAFVYGAYQFIDVEGRRLHAIPPVPIGEDAYETLLRGNCIGMHATVMYRRDRLEEVGGFDPPLFACEDYELYLRLACRHPAASGSECIAEYRQNVNAMSQNVPLMLRSVLTVLRRQRPHLKGNPRWRAAYKAGLRGWKRYYARQEITRVRGVLIQPSRPKRRRALKLAEVFRLAPATVVKLALPQGMKRLRRRMSRPARGAIDFGDLRRTTPVSRVFGYDRGSPVDRRYIESFLARHADDIRGRVLEIGDNAYTVRFGGGDVTQSDILHVSEVNPDATIVGDLAHGEHLPSEAFDCIVLTQTLHLVFDLHAATATLHRILKPRGVLLMTVPGVSSVDRGDWGTSWYWSLTAAALKRLLEERFPGSGLAVTTYGNVLTAVAFLHGLAVEDLRPQDFEKTDAHYPVIVAARAVKEGPDHARTVGA